MRLCGGVSAVHLLKLTACTIISKPQNTGLLVNQKASYRRKQTQQTSRRAAGGGGVVRPPQRIGVGWASGGQAGGLRGQSGAMGWQRSRSSPGAGRSACQVASRGLRPALAGRSSTNTAMRRSAGRGLRSVPVGCSAQRACGAGKALRCARASFDIHFDTPILPFAMLVPCLPIFWALLQENGPKFDVTPEFLGGFRETILCRIFLTWGNACARGWFSPFPLAKPPRSSGDPITVA